MEAAVVVDRRRFVRGVLCGLAASCILWEAREETAQEYLDRTAAQRRRDLGR